MKKLLITIAFIFMIGAPLTIQSNNAHAATQSSATTQEYSIDINTATKIQLESTPGIGNILSQRIIDNRPYETFDDLLQVKGVGEKTIQNIKANNIGINITNQPVVVTDDTKIELNTATKEQLETITGIGGVLSQRIIDNRPYKTLDDLLKVKGIGEKILQKIKEQNIAYVIDLDANIISDPSLQKAINRTLQHPDNSPVTKEKLTNLTSLTNIVLTASDAKIKSLDGLEFAVNLKILKLENQEIADISPLQSIYALAQLNLKNNLITDISPLYRPSGTSLEKDPHKLLTNINLASNRIEKLNIDLLEHFGSKNQDDCYINLDNNYVSQCSVAVGNVSALHQRSFNHDVFDLSTFPPTQNSIELQGVYSGQSYNVLPYLEGEPNGKVVLFDRRDSFDENTNTITSTDLRNRDAIVYEVYTSYTGYSASYDYSYIVTILLQ
ncbi:hypothetical protein HCA99_16375 [Listeria booriae]|uniref:helix-hairpin-helix domain-containing protein n=1 Tax=Listeria booriae TaxID=1552123 RepID=UPI0016238153|nr:helix-hairpin-helix domain-containing protein [Listeria booriae]MBC2080809.1 hypothetical protein [Listeria booriae]